MPAGLSGQQHQVSHTTPQPAESQEDPFAFLKYFDTFFLIDDSASMTPFWTEVTAIARTIAPICVEHDASGIDIYFANHKPHGSLFGGIAKAGYRHIGLATGVADMHDNVDGIFNCVKPYGTGDITKLLRKVLQGYMRDYECRIRETQSTRTTKPMNIIVVTANMLDLDTVETIAEVAGRLDELKAPSYQVGVQLFQVGDNEAVASWMHRMDNNIRQAHNVRDIVDTVTRTGGSSVLSPEGVLKGVGGAVKRSIDSMALKSMAASDTQTP
jgi:hypothetical protein